MGPLAALIPGLLPVLGEILDRIIPDKAEAAKARLDMEAKLLEAATAQAGQQAAINQVEASSSSIFVAGWRPFIGWVCGAGLAWAFIVAPLASWLMIVLGVKQTMPHLEIEHLLELVVAMLGLGGLRTFEKLKGVARQ
jgi:hypothetical protein